MQLSPPSIHLAGGKVGLGITHSASFYRCRAIRRVESCNPPSLLLSLPRYKREERLNTSSLLLFLRHQTTLWYHISDLPCAGPAPREPGPRAQRPQTATGPREPRPRGEFPHVLSKGARLGRASPLFQSSQAKYSCWRPPSCGPEIKGGREVRTLPPSLSR